MSFLDFNYTNGALNLFEQTIRNTVDFNAMEDDVFEARVLTTPTRITNNIASIGSTALSSNDSNIKHSFRVRILGPLSAHNFIEDPCGLDKFSDEISKQIGFSILQNHTEVIIDDEWASPSMGDVVIIKLERTTKKNNKRGFNYKNAKQYLGVARKSPLPEPNTTQQLCDKLSEVFENADFSSLGNTPAYSGALVNTTPAGLKYFGQWNVGASPPGFWESFSKRFEAHVNKLYPELGLNQANLGATRDLAAAANASNPARASGSKHGAALAKDHYLHTKLYGQYTSYKNDNPKLAKDQKFVDAIIDFMEQPEQADLLWGGTFGGGATAKGNPPRGRGITEFHHFEFKSDKMPALFEPYREQLAEIGIKPEQLTSTSALKTLYLKLL